MTALQKILHKSQATVRIDTSFNWSGWMERLCRPFAGGKADSRPRIQVLDRISLGGKKSLVLVSVEQHRLLIGVGDTEAPSIVKIEAGRRTTRSLKAGNRRIAMRGPQRYGA